MFRSVLVVCLLVSTVASGQVRRLRVAPEAAEAVECTITAASGSVAAVQAAHDDGSVTTGSTVCIPPGTHNWASALNITKAITVRGASNCTLDGVTERATDCSTVIIDDVLGDNRLIDITLVTGQTSRVAHLEIQGGARQANIAINGIIRIVGTNTAIAHTGRYRIDHNVLTDLEGVDIRPVGAYGVADHNTLTTDGDYVMYVYAGTFTTWIDARWAEASNLGMAGGDNAVFFENNTVTSVTGSISVFDSYAGARIVYRHNTLVNATIDCHGTDSAGRARGCRSMEVYENTFTGDGAHPAGGAVGFRSATGVLYNNTLTSFGGTPRIATAVYDRLTDDFDVWNISDGAHPADVNDAGNPQSQHTATGGGALTVTVSGAGWTPNALIGYIIRKTTAPCNVPIVLVDTGDEEFHTTGVSHGFTTGNTVGIKNHTGSTPHILGHYTATVVDGDTFTLNGQNITVAGTGGTVSIGGLNKQVCASPVVSNTDDTLTFAASFRHDVSVDNDMTFAAADTFDLNLITEALDSPGRSGGANFNGVTLPVTLTNTQIDDPIYEWENYEDGVDVDIAVSAQYSLLIRSGEHYINDTVKPGYTAYTYPHPLTLTP